MLQRLRWMCVLSLLCFAAGQASSQNTWSGQAQCQLSVQSQGFVHQEIQTWALTGAAPSQQGAMQIYPATWSVTGQGGAQRPTLVAQWNNNVPGMNAPLAIFIRASDNRLIIKSWHSLLVAPAGIMAVKQTNGAQSSTSAAVSEWIFPQIDADPNATAVSGTGTVNVPGNSIAIPSAGAVGTANCKWEFSKGGQSVSKLASVPAVSGPALMSQAPVASANSPGSQTQTTASVPAVSAVAKEPAPISNVAQATSSGSFVPAVAGPGAHAAGADAGATSAPSSSQVGSQAPTGVAKVGAANPSASSMTTPETSTAATSCGALSGPQNGHLSVANVAANGTLPAPTAFRAESLGDGSVRFNWQAVTGASQYRLDGPGIAVAGLYITAANPSTTKIIPVAAGGTVPSTALGTRIQNVPLGPGTWHIAAVDSHNLYDPKLTSTASAIVRGVPPHAGQWLTKNNGKGSVGQAVTHYLSLCPQCAPGASFSDVLKALGIARGSSLDGSEPALDDGNNLCVDDPSLPCIWTDIHAARYDNVTEFGTNRITRCWEALPGSNGPRTLCYSNSGDHGLTAIVKDQSFAWFLTFAWNDNAPSQFPNSTKEVINWFGKSMAPPTSNYVLTTEVMLDSEGPKSPPHACLSCHGGKFDGTRVSGATLLPLDTGLLRIDDRSAAMASNFAQVNQAVLFHGPSPAVQRYLTGLYGGFPTGESGWGDLDYVPQGWKQQSDFYKTAVRPYCMMCHLATPSNLDFSTYGSFAQNKELINAEVCSGHTMPHAEYPFKQFWTKDTGKIFLPGYLAAAIGITNCQ